LHDETIATVVRSEAIEMRLVPRHRRRQRSATGMARIEISQAEITADLAYRGEGRRLEAVQASAARSRR